MADIIGEYVSFDQGKFRYRYTCACGRSFYESSPTISAPAICDSCYTGGNYKRNEGECRRRERSEHYQKVRKARNARKKGAG